METTFFDRYQHMLKASRILGRDYTRGGERAGATVRSVKYLT